MALKSQWYPMLVAMTEGARHGAEIRRQIREAPGGETEIYPATLYGSLEDLLGLGYITEIGDADGQPSGRRSYQITACGHEVLLGETQRLERMTRAARAALRRT